MGSVTFSTLPHGRFWPCLVSSLDARLLEDSTFPHLSALLRGSSYQVPLQKVTSMPPWAVDGGPRRQDGNVALEAVRWNLVPVGLHPPPPPVVSPDVRVPGSELRGGWWGRDGGTGGTLIKEQNPDTRRHNTAPAFPNDHLGSGEVGVQLGGDPPRTPKNIQNLGGRGSAVLSLWLRQEEFKSSAK